MTQPDPQLAPLEQALLNQLVTSAVTERLVVAFSGGVDSKVLLNALVRLRSLNYISRLSAIHVNHGLQAYADEWQARCELDCDQYQVPLQVAQLPKNLNKQPNLEAVVRDGRYRAFESLLGPAHWLLMAHHQDDQAETLLFRLLRGCGINGAAAMPQSRPLGRGTLFRPMLGISRVQIEEYARHNQLDWLEDPSNQQTEFSRNYIRHQLVPTIREKWPGYVKTLTRFSDLAREQSELLTQLAQEDLLQVQSSAGNLQIAELSQLSLARQKNVLHCWISNGRQLPPSSNEIHQILSQLTAALTGASINIDISDSAVRSYAGQLMIVSKHQPSENFEETVWHDITQSLRLSNGVMLNVSSEPAIESSGSGLRLPHNSERVLVRSRQGGENCLPDYRGKSATLKKIYQELAVPPWQRKWLPLIYYNEQLVAVPGVFIAKSFLGEKSQNLLQISLDVPAFEK